MSGACSRTADRPSTPRECSGSLRKKSNHTAGVPRLCERLPGNFGAASRERGMDFIVKVADKLFSGRNLEEKVFAVFLLEKQTRNLGDDEFRLFVCWLDRVSSWADHDALVHDVLAPMIVSDPARCHEVFR